MRSQTVHRLKTERLNRGLSVRMAAVQIGIHHRTLYRAEMGEGLHPANAKLIADYYGVQVTDLWPLKDAA